MGPRSHLAVVGQRLKATRLAFDEATRGVAARALELGWSQSDAPLAARAEVARNIAGAAGVLGFNDAFLAGAAVVLAGAVPALFLISKPSAREAGPFAQTSEG